MRRFTMRRLAKRKMISSVGGQVSGMNRRKRAEKKKRQTEEATNYFKVNTTKPPQPRKPFNILDKAIVRGLSSHGVFICKCGSDSWAVVRSKFLFLSADLIYCENCKKALPSKNQYGFINYKEFVQAIS